MKFTFKASGLSAHQLVQNLIFYQNHEGLNNLNQEKAHKIFQHSYLIP